jgi:hypothetical protein
MWLCAPFRTAAAGGVGVLVMRTSLLMQAVLIIFRREPPMALCRTALRRR